MSFLSERELNHNSFLLQLSSEDQARHDKLVPLFAGDPARLFSYALYAAEARLKESLHEAGKSVKLEPIAQSTASLDENKRDACTNTPKYTLHDYAGVSPKRETTTPESSRAVSMNSDNISVGVESSPNMISFQVGEVPVSSLSLSTLQLQRTSTVSSSDIVPIIDCLSESTSEDVRHGSQSSVLDYGSISRQNVALEFELNQPADNHIVDFCPENTSPPSSPNRFPKVSSSIKSPYSPAVKRVHGRRAKRKRRNNSSGLQINRLENGVPAIETLSRSPTTIQSVEPPNNIESSASPSSCQKSSLSAKRPRCVQFLGSLPLAAQRLEPSEAVQSSPTSKVRRNRPEKLSQCEETSECSQETNIVYAAVEADTIPTSSLSDRGHQPAVLSHDAPNLAGTISHTLPTVASPCPQERDEVAAYCREEVQIQLSKLTCNDLEGIVMSVSDQKIIKLSSQLQTTDDTQSTSSTASLQKSCLFIPIQTSSPILKPSVNRTRSPQFHENLLAMPSERNGRATGLNNVRELATKMNGFKNTLKVSRRAFHASSTSHSALFRVKLLRRQKKRNNAKRKLPAPPIKLEKVSSPLRIQRVSTRTSCTNYEPLDNGAESGAPEQQLNVVHPHYILIGDSPRRRRTVSYNSQFNEARETSVSSADFGSCARTRIHHGLGNSDRRKKNHFFTAQVLDRSQRKTLVIDHTTTTFQLSPTALQESSGNKPISPLCNLKFSSVPQTTSSGSDYIDLSSAEEVVPTVNDTIVTANSGTNWSVGTIGDIMSQEFARDFVSFNGNKRNRRRGSPRAKKSTIPVPGPYVRGKALQVHSAAQSDPTPQKSPSRTNRFNCLFCCNRGQKRKNCVCKIPKSLPITAPREPTAEPQVAPHLIPDALSCNLPSTFEVALSKYKSKYNLPK